MTMKNFRAWTAVLPVISVVLIGPLGCDRNARLADKDIRHVTVRAVTHYGMTLDEQASPEKTAFVLLSAIWDDFFAKDEAERKAALDVQFDVAAADVLAARNPTSLGRDELIYQVVNRWTPTVSHYVHDFETEWELARSRLRGVRSKLTGGQASGAEEHQVLMAVADANADQNARVLLVVSLIQDNGFWRVMRVGFIQDARGLPDGST